ncbi:MAG: hypothetical protein NVSMB66_4740 [Candidatus Doudnabacteria bacterium]
MYKGTDLIGKPVVSHSGGAALDSIKDVIFDSSSARVLGFLLEEKGMFSKGKILPLENIQAIGPDAITVLSPNSIVEPEKHTQISDLAAAENVALGTKIMSEDGRNLGKISDIYFNEHSGALEGYEVSGGVFSDAYTGKSYLPSPEKFKIGKDVAFVPNDIAQMMEEQVGGIKGSVQKAGAKVSKSASKVGEQIGGQIDIIGKRIKSTVYSDNGSIIAAQGQLVTEQMENKAKELGKETELYAATAAVAVENIGTKANNALGKTTKGISRSFTQLKDKASHKLTELKDKNSQIMEEKRIKAALGRPVTRVILDQQDQPILKTGDLITHQAINQAKDAQALDILLDSVYKEDPKFSSDELKAAGI